MHPSPDRPADPGRRALLVAGVRGLAAAGLGPLVLAGCADGDPDGAQTVEPTVAALFSPFGVVAAGRPQRFPFRVIDPPNDLADDAVLDVTIRSGSTVVATTVAAGHVIVHDHPTADVEPHVHTGLNRYFSFEATLPEPGVHDVEIAVGDGSATLAIQAFADDEVAIVQPGEQMPSIATPTFGDPGSLEAVCTRLPEPCPFHDTSLDVALAGGRPLAVLVTSPGVCRTAYCGPSLAALVALAETREGLEVLHLEAFENPVSADYDPNRSDLRTAAHVDQLGLDAGPNLFVVDPDGIVAARLDSVFDETELRAALDLVS